MNKSICFITTGDIKNIATAKRALGLANPLSKLGWDVSIIIENTLENQHRCKMECDEQIKIYYLTYKNALDERNQKRKLIKQINPQVIYICAFVFRNIIRTPKESIKLVEHSELQSGIKDIKNIQKLRAYFQEFYSIFLCKWATECKQILRRSV